MAWDSGSWSQTGQTWAKASDDGAWGWANAGCAECHWNSNHWREPKENGAATPDPWLQSAALQESFGAAALQDSQAANPKDPYPQASINAEKNNGSGTNWFGDFSSDSRDGWNTAMQSAATSGNAYRDAPTCR